jgi:hypothetical protein
MSENAAFCLAWTGIILKRILTCTYLYCDHQKIDIDSTIFLKCLKYNLFAPTGIVAELVPYLQKAFTQGFLMPKEYNDNECVKKAIRLFGEAYRLTSIKDRETQKKEANLFLEKILESFSSEVKNKKEISLILNLPGFVSKENPHICTYCELIDSWNIDFSLFSSDTKYHAILLYTLISLLQINKD